jgi:hypothetical protein
MTYLHTKEQGPKRKFENVKRVKTKPENQTILFAFCFGFAVTSYSLCFLTITMSNSAETFGVYVRIYLNHFRKLFVPYWQDIAK